MDRAQMQTLVQQIPTERLEHYVENYEAGNVGGYVPASNCVATSFLVPLEAIFGERLNAWSEYITRVEHGVGGAPTAGDLAVRALEMAYRDLHESIRVFDLDTHQHRVDALEEPFRRQVYEAVVEELAARRAESRPAVVMGAEFLELVGA